MYLAEDPTISKMAHEPVKLTLDESGIVEEETRTLFAKLEFDLIININMIHIAPWEATLGLMKVAGEKLSKDSWLFLYGPFKVNGKCVESNR